jgi:hypothetical protein
LANGIRDLDLATAFDQEMEEAMSQQSTVEDEELGPQINDPTNDSANGESALKPRLNLSPAIETDFAELEDGSLVDLIEDPEDSSRTLLVIFNGNEARYVHEYEYKNRLLVPILRDGKIIRHVRLPRGIKPCGSADNLMEQIDSVLSRCIDLQEKYRFLLASFVLSTWFVERLPVAPYVALVGLPRSGKSTVLKVLSLLCRRSLLTADITSAAFYRVCDRLMPTLLIDETGTAGERKQLFHLLRTGISRDVIALRKDQSFSAFGAKVVSWIELPNDAALNSRCVMIPLHETRRSDLKRPMDGCILEAAEDLQKQLLHYRLEKYRALSLPEITHDTPLYSRSRDLYEALALPMGECSKASCENLFAYFTHHKIRNREPLYPTHAAVLAFLYYNIHLHRCIQDGHRCVTPELIAGLTRQVNHFLEEEGEHFRLNPRQVGAALTALGLLNRKRTRVGWEILLDKQDMAHIHDLIAFYGTDYGEVLDTEVITHCEYCANSDDPTIQEIIRWKSPGSTG